MGIALPAGDHTLKFFPGFKSFRVKTSGAEIHGVVGGSGPPVLLLHGVPQSHVTWRLVAPGLAATHTVITCPLGVLWAEKGAMARIYDVMAIWKERGTNVTGRALQGRTRNHVEWTALRLDHFPSGVLDHFPGGAPRC